MPAWQCTSTRPPLCFTESTREVGRGEKRGQTTTERWADPEAPTGPRAVARLLPMKPMASGNQALISTI